MKLTHIIILATLFLTLVFAQSIEDEPENSISDVIENAVSDASFGFVENGFDFMNDFVMLDNSHGDDDFQIVQHDGDELIRRVTSRADGVTTEFYTIVHVGITSSGEIEQDYVSADDQLLSEYFAGEMDILVE